MSLTEKTTHVSEAQSHLIEQFKSKTRILAVVESFVEQVQEIEAVLFDLMEERWIDAAVGVQLDGLGDIVGEPRNGRGDDDYRLAIKARVQINLSSGEPERIIHILNLLTGSTITLSEYFPAAFVADIDDPVDGLLDTGSHTGANNQPTLSDTMQSWAVNELVGKTIVNETDDSIGIITANTAQTVTATLSGGTDNDWDTSDVYSIYQTPVEISNAVQSAKAAGVGAQLIYTLTTETFMWGVDDHGWGEGRWAGALP